MNPLLEAVVKEYLRAFDAIDAYKARKGSAQGLLKDLRGLAKKIGEAWEEYYFSVKKPEGREGSDVNIPNLTDQHMLDYDIRRDKDRKVSRIQDSWDPREEIKNVVHEHKVNTETTRTNLALYFTIAQVEVNKEHIAKVEEAIAFGIQCLEWFIVDLGGYVGAMEEIGAS